MSLNPKVFQKFSLGLNQNQQAGSKNMKRGKQQNKTKQKDL
jgi:hypothetical protein